MKICRHVSRHATNSNIILYHVCTIAYRGKSDPTPSKAFALYFKMQRVVFVGPLQLEIAVSVRNTGVVHHPSMHIRMDFVNSISKNGQYNESADFACECHGCRFCSSCENSQSEQLEDVSSVPNTQNYCAVNAR